MVYASSDNFRHIILNGFSETEEFRSPPQGGSTPAIPGRNRAEHGSNLQSQLNELPSSDEIIVNDPLEPRSGEGSGIQVEFESFPEIDLAFESLARERSGIELLNVRHIGNTTFATVFLPDGKLSIFERFIEDYLAEKRDSIGRARDHQRLIDAIRYIRAATVKALWTDGEFPTDERCEFWWEAWIRLPIGQDPADEITSFRERAESLGMITTGGEVIFPERAVLLLYSSVTNMQASVLFLNHIAEFRRAKETADFFDAMAREEQAEWLDELLSRTSMVDPSQDSPHVCILDTGVNRGHPLLTSALSAEDVHTVDPNWGADDLDGHGTEMAGLALFGDLTSQLSGNHLIHVNHRLESVKLLPQDGANGNDANHHGYLTQEAVARAETTSPFRRRVTAMAVTARDNRDRGIPSAWSAALDSLASDSLQQSSTLAC